MLVFNHALLELVIGKNWLTKLNFRRLIPEVNLPFYSYRKIAIGVLARASSSSAWAP